MFDVGRCAGGHGSLRPLAALALALVAGHFHVDPPQTASHPAELAGKLRCSYTVGMGDLRFEWDPRKSLTNAQKHGVSFEEAKSVFSDERAKLIDDPGHSEDEDRFILMGLSGSLRMLVVCHCYREEDNVIRIISARKATAKEARFYQ
jgi:hypothetical protein